MIIPGRSSVMKKTIHLPLVQTDGRNLGNLPYTHLSHLLYSALTPYMLTPQGSTPKGQTAAADLGTDYRRGVFFCPRFGHATHVQRNGVSPWQTVEVDEPRKLSDVREAKSRQRTWGDTRSDARRSRVRVGAPCQPAGTVSGGAEARMLRRPRPGSRRFRGVPPAGITPQSGEGAR
jgi:hypothetical protein